MDIPIYIVDAFTDVAFSGNPAAVVLLDSPAPEAWMQSVAMEMNFSETAFVTSTSSDGSTPLGLRWFTPKAEVDLCGHATLAAVHVLGGDQQFNTRSGLLTCKSADGWIEMDFPSDMPHEVEPERALLEGLGNITPRAVGRGISSLLVELNDPSEVRNLRPNLQFFESLTCSGVIVTAAADLNVDGVDFVSRCFYPAIGIPEDPVTGSAHCTLASWWTSRLGKREMLAEQASSRGGYLRVSYRDSRVGLYGQAVTVMQGKINGMHDPNL